MIKEKKEIEGIALLNCKRNPKGKNCADCSFSKKQVCDSYGCCSYEIAEKIVQNGYGNKKNAVKEFIEELMKEKWLTVTVDKFVVCVEDIEKIFNRIYGK